MAFVVLVLLKLGKVREKKVKWKFVSHLMIILFLLISNVVQGVNADTPVSINGRLKLVGNQLANCKGQPIQLRGISSKGLHECSRCLNDASIDAMANDWGADIIRLPIRPKYYVKAPDYYNAQMDKKVDKALEYGMYCIIDWHGFKDPNAYLNEAKRFFAYMSKKHGKKGHVLYEVINEPTDVDWIIIKSYAEKIIPIIRENDPEGIIIVGTPYWSGHPGDVLKTPGPINGANAHNLMYAVHFYAGHHGEKARKERLGDGVTDHIPIFVTEWGAQDASGQGKNDIGSAQKWIDLMAAKKISWCNWCYCDEPASSHVFKSGTCPKGPWTDSTLKESGYYLMDWLKSPIDDFVKSQLDPVINFRVRGYE